MVEIKPKNESGVVTSAEVREALEAHRDGTLIMVPAEHVKHTCRNWAYLNGYRVSYRKLGHGVAVVWVRDKDSPTPRPRGRRPSHKKAMAPTLLADSRFESTVCGDDYDYEAESDGCGIRVRLESTSDGADRILVYFKDGDGWPYAFSVAKGQTKVERSSKVFGVQRMPLEEEKDDEMEMEGGDVSDA